jgi:hypothetical protein
MAVVVAGEIIELVCESLNGNDYQDELKPASPSLKLSRR